MHKTNILSVEYKNQSVRFNDPQISEINGKLYIWNESPGDFGPVYDAFDYPELISELITLVKKGKSGKDKVLLTKMWVRKWGVLNRELITENIIGQRMDLFWRQAEDFELIWRLYKYIANREKDKLEKMGQILESIDDLKHFSDDKIINNQWNAMMFITKSIEQHTKNGIIQSSEIKRFEEKEDDTFKIKPAFYFHQLNDSLYMQFFLALTENKKVCPICESPFTPNRPDQIYDKESCKHTAKSRRYREKKYSIFKT